MCASKTLRKQMTSQNNESQIFFRREILLFETLGATTVVPVSLVDLSTVSNCVWHYVYLLF